MVVFSPSTGEAVLPSFPSSTCSVVSSESLLSSQPYLLGFCRDFNSLILVGVSFEVLSPNRKEEEVEGVVDVVVVVVVLKYLKMFEFLKMFTELFPRILPLVVVVVVVGVVVVVVLGEAAVVSDKIVLSFGLQTFTLIPRSS